MVKLLDESIELEMYVSVLNERRLRAAFPDDTVNVFEYIQKNGTINRATHALYPLTLLDIYGFHKLKQDLRTKGIIMEVGMQGKKNAVKFKDANNRDAPVTHDRVRDIIDDLLK